MKLREFMLGTQANYHLHPKRSSQDAVLIQTQGGGDYGGVGKLYPAAPDAVSRIDNSSSKLVPDWNGAALVDALSFNNLYEFIAGWGDRGTLRVVSLNVASIIGPAAS
ncbi:conidial pigment polyketide synthase alb1 [Moniliophthora roreri]|nr:conidial pigment polyketide synthase alb1 [Moniliophthora roreri]